MSNGMIYVQRSFREIARAVNKFWLVESWFWIQCPAAADTSHSGTIFDQVGQSPNKYGPPVWRNSKIGDAESGADF